MLARRLIVGGVEAFEVPTPLGVTSLGLTGFWNNICDSRAATYNGKTYIGYIDDANDIHVASFTHATETVSSPFLVGTGFSSPSGAIHNGIAVVVRSSDHKILIVECAEAGSQPFARATTSAEDATAWDSAFAILASGSYTYPTLVELDNGVIYLLVRRLVGGTYYLAMSSSVNGGETWSGITSIVAPVTGASNPGNANYWRIASHGNRIHFLVTDTERLDANPSSVYHMYFEDGEMFATDGTSLGSSWPIAVTSGTLVHDDSDGPAWSEGLAFDIDGNPAGVLLVYDGAKNLIRQVQWTGAAWETNDVADSVGVIGSNRFIAGAAIAKADPFTIYANREVSGTFELFRYVSTNDGATWSGTAITTGSASDNAMPDTPTNASDLAVVWGRGTYTGDDDFDFTVYGHG